MGLHHHDAKKTYPDCFQHCLKPPGTGSGGRIPQIIKTLGKKRYQNREEEYLRKDFKY